MPPQCNEGVEGCRISRWGFSSRRVIDVGIFHVGFFQRYDMIVWNNACKLISVLRFRCLKHGKIFSILHASEMKHFSACGAQLYAGDM